MFIKHIAETYNVYGWFTRDDKILGAKYEIRDDGIVNTNVFFFLFESFQNAIGDLINYLF